jgi:hypothetical protein
MSFSDLAGLVTFRPLSEPLPPATYAGEYSSPFSASWSSTVELLARELRALRPKQSILEVAIPVRAIRVDGLPRADARASSPGVILTLNATRHGHDLRYPAHHFHDWRENVRALALALEALRKVDRYGITQRGQQYAGWKALPSGSGPDAARGRTLIAEAGSVRAALAKHHPDHGGDARDFGDVTAAREEGAR